jgi:predicted nuclease of predicted toxin-antitoxin system
VKLLFDQNLSPNLVSRLADVFPDSDHVSALGLDKASDDAVWNYARVHGFTLVSKDADFSDMNLLRGYPPKVLWLRVGNCTTGQVEALLRLHHQAVEQMESDPAVGILALS